MGPHASFELKFDTNGSILGVDEENNINLGWRRQTPDMGLHGPLELTMGKVTIFGMENTKIMVSNPPAHPPTQYVKITQSG